MTDAERELDKAIHRCLATLSGIGDSMRHTLADGRPVLTDPRLPDRIDLCRRRLVDALDLVHRARR